MLEFDSVKKFLKHVGAPISLYDDFDVRKMDSALTGYKSDFEPFRHRIFSLSLFQEPGSGQWKLNFKKPFEVITPGSRPERIAAYYVCWTEKFMLKHKHFGDLVLKMPYLKLKHVQALKLEEPDFLPMINLYQQMLTEYHSDQPDKFPVIVSYLNTLMLIVKRIFDVTDSDREKSILGGNDLAVAERFHDLLELKVRNLAEDKRGRMVSYYASKLAVHPNYLNEAVKKTYGKTARAMVQEHLLFWAKNLLLQTGLSIKAIAYQLAFSEPAHFINFFKKQTGIAPTRFRTLNV